MIRIGVLAPSEIAYRRFVPAIINSEIIQYVGVACAQYNEWDELSKDVNCIPRELEKANKFKEAFGGRVYEGYHSMLSANDIDAIYVPLPPGLHYKWGNEVIDANKHLFLEKPFSDSLSHTKELIENAAKNNLAVHENFAFVYHKQLYQIRQLISSGAIGEVRLIRTAFGFPYRGKEDFRYHRSMGGGALLDCGGYPTRLAQLLLGDSVKVLTSALSSAREHDVDVYGSATLCNDNNQVAQISFGMDNAYKCELEVWGSSGVLQTSRVFTPTADMETVITIKSDNCKEYKIEPDDQFLHSAECFVECINDLCTRDLRMKEILTQAQLMEDIRRMSI